MLRESFKAAQSLPEKQDPAKVSRHKAMILATALGTNLDDMIFKNDT